ncbi:hypothetical protein LMG26857_06740 [Achromobacter anxifer]|nr:hypothetical protein LMG26857_06740 [Achromobacter anxifer]
MGLRLLGAPAVAARLVVVTQQSQLDHQGGNERGIQFFPAAAAQRARQDHVTEAGADQPTDGDAHGFEHAANFAVAAFLQGDPVPAVAAVAAQVVQRTERSHAVVQFDAIDQRLALGLVHLAQHADRVLALRAVARMHDAVGHVAGGREDQQAFRIQVQAADRQPFAGAQLGQAGEDAGATARVVMADDLSGRLVIQDHARRLLRIGAHDGLAVHAHLVVGRHALADMGRLAVDRHPPRDDQFFHFAARTNAGVRQHLVQLGHDRIAVQVLAQALLHAIRGFQVRQRLFGFLLRAARLLRLGLSGDIRHGLRLGLACRRLLGRGVAATAAERRSQLAAAPAGARLAFGRGCGGGIRLAAGNGII